MQQLAHFAALWWVMCIDLWALGLALGTLAGGCTHSNLACDVSDAA